LVSVVAAYRYTTCIYQNAVLRCGKYAHVSQWVGHCSVCRDTPYVVAQRLIVTLQAYICKRRLENHFLELDVNGNVLLEIGLKELVPRMIVSTELMWD
jgi:hypothetical protein